MTSVRCCRFIALIAFSIIVSSTSAATRGYYRQPAVHGDMVVFVAEGDLWKVPLAGGVARRLTTHHGPESHPAISPDGQTVAFIATYEGPTEVYTMPIDGGLPTRRTFDAARCEIQGFTPDGRLLFATRHYAAKRDMQLVALDLATGVRERIPLEQAAQGAYANETTLIFTRLTFQGSHTKRYKGGTAQNIWRFTAGDLEARPLTADFAGTSRSPMPHAGRVYFVSDRDGTMNIWSMRNDGSDVRAHTTHVGFDVATPDLHGNSIVYQRGADLEVYDIASRATRVLRILLESDLDQKRETWITNPMGWLTSAHASPDGKSVVLTARGEVFVAPHRQGRIVTVTRAPDVRYRDARFMPGGEQILAIGDATDELEFWLLPADGTGATTQLTSDGSILRWEGIPSPDGRWLAHHDKNMKLWVLNIDTGEQHAVDESPSQFDSVEGLTWSADSQWLAYAVIGPNQHRQIRIHRPEDGTLHTVTTDRYDSYSPAWSADGTWLYFLSDRHFRSLVGAPWGPRQPEPFYDRPTRIYALALQPGQRSPFRADDELSRAAAEAEEESEDVTPNAGADEPMPVDDSNDDVKADDEAPEPIEIDFDGISQRLHDVPVPPGNYSNLMATADRLLYIARHDLHAPKRHLTAIKITNDEPKPETLVEDIASAELTPDRATLLVRHKQDLHLIPADTGAPAKLDKTSVKLDGWAFSYQPAEQWRQMYTESWRLLRDYFYDRNMHGVDWPAMRDKYMPLVERVSDRDELADIMAQLTGELSALHHFVRPGDARRGDENVFPASLGAILARDANAGGYRIEHIYESDPDEPQRRAPLHRHDLDINPGDVILAVNGQPALEGAAFESHLRNLAHRQVLLSIRSAVTGDTFDAIIEPITTGELAEMRYREWEVQRRRLVDEWSDGRIGYVHLRAMGGGNMSEFVRDYYPVHDRQGLIMDVRHNRGGNIDSWVLSRLMRKAWFFWQGRAGQPMWNMQFAFRGHMVALCNERTASDGEAFAEGFKRLGLGDVIGTRTWGGEIWLSSSNLLVDRGIATAAEFGVYGPEGAWLIEGHGVEPDITVDNLPHASFNGSDAQLRAAVDHLLQKIAQDPRAVPPVPAFPDKSSNDNR